MTIIDQIEFDHFIYVCLFLFNCTFPVLISRAPKRNLTPQKQQSQLVCMNTKIKKNVRKKVIFFHIIILRWNKIMIIYVEDLAGRVVLGRALSTGRLVGSPCRAFGLLVPRLCKYDRKSIRWGRIIHIPFSEFRQCPPFIVLLRSTKLTCHQNFTMKY